MSKLVRIVCDNCNSDLTDTGNSIDWRLALINERKECRDVAVTNMMIYPSIDRDAYFCGLGCLRAWLTKKP